MDPVTSFEIAFAVLVGLPALLVFFGAGLYLLIKDVLKLI